MDHERVVVTDIRMPFWSMVVFMVKAAIAAIPALLLLSIFGALVTALLGGLFASMNTRVTASSPLPAPRPPVATNVRSTRTTDAVPDRCVGNPNPVQCRDLELRMAEETPQQREARQKSLEAEREANMAKVR